MDRNNQVNRDWFRRMAEMEDQCESIGAAAVRFAARSETNAALNADEKEALDEFVRVLVESTD